MRLHRLALRNYRGVSQCQVEIAPQGVTVIQGPNEIGKSSLAEAINLLLDEPDGSGKRQVKATKPLDRDLGPEVELELTTGPHRVVYSKRWLVKPQTILHIHTPTPESLTGRAAHDRMKSILEETLDQALWTALRYQQGETIVQAAMGQSRTLTAALDACASGGVLGGEEEDSLWTQIEAQRASFFTNNGKPSAARRELQAEVARLSGEVVEHQSALHALEVAAERHRQLGFELAETTQQHAEQEQVVHGYQQTVGEIEAKRRALAELDFKVREAELLERGAHVSATRRGELLRAFAQAETDLAALVKANTQHAHEMQLESAAKADALTRLDQAERLVKTADHERTMASNDHEHCRNVLDSQMLKERLANVQAAEDEQKTAQDFLSSCLIDEPKTAALHAASLAAQVAKSNLNAQAVAIHIDALQDLNVLAGGERTELSTTGQFDSEIAGELKLTLEGIADITVTGGQAHRALSEAATQAELRFHEACAAAGVDTTNAFAEANTAEQKRKQAELAVVRAGQTLESNLRDLTPELMVEKVERLQARIAQYLEQRATATPTPVPLDLDQANEIRQRTDKASETASRALDECRQELAVLEGKLGELELAATERRVNIEVAESQVETCKDELADAREMTADETVQHNLDTAKNATANARAHQTEQANQLAAQDPDGTIALLENSREVLVKLKDRESEIEREQIALRRELDLRGEAGIQDQLAQAEASLEQLRREQEQTDRRAQAAELLYTVTKARRDQAKRAYAAPFKDKLEALARIVFGQGAEIHVDYEDLKVLSRTLDGVTVPYDSLSVGAREQICVLSRLACACLVAANSEKQDYRGAPVIFDDALGNSDPQRLERLGAVFNVASKETQIIVLTCTPDRFRNVGSGSVIRLEDWQTVEIEALEAVPA
jgi:energy-coupling factor transporter ATP-binding protein EcfA2